MSRFCPGGEGAGERGECRGGLNAVTALARQPEEAFAGGVKPDNWASVWGKAAQAGPCVAGLYEWNVDCLTSAPMGPNRVIC